ncbi:MAG TPA: LCP family protein [Candidatus Limnocylindria bacterium]|nr:LCP family protein [Candidatus Limnocylindria bacterium]
MSRARPRARRSRYHVTYRLTRSVPALILVALLLVVLVGATFTYARLDSFVAGITGQHINPLGEIVQAVEPAPGTIAYKLKHNQRVNILLLGRGGYENDAPFLTDSIMAVSIDPVSNRVMLVSIPRDLTVEMNLQDPPSRIWANKVNAAYEVPYTNIICCVAKAYTGRNGGGKAAEHEVGKITGLTFDKFIAVDFIAFRDVVNALGGVDVCLTTNLDDNSYPDYHGGYNPIHFKAGCRHYNGEQALQIARSRHAIQAEQSSDFGRARRQQDIMYSIKKKATSVNGFSKAPQLLSALQKNITTDMTLSDMKAIYDWGKNLPNSSIIKVALTAPQPGTEGNLLDFANCGMGPYVSQLCPLDQSYGMIHRYIKNILLDPNLLAEKAPIQFANGSNNFTGLEGRVTDMLDPTGLLLSDPVAHQPVSKTVVLDYSGGQFPLTAKWLASYFGATIVPATSTKPARARGQQAFGLVVVLGHDYASRFLGL